MYTVKNAFRLERARNGNSRVAFMCTVIRCSWRVHASPNQNKGHFQIKTRCSKHTCARNNKKYEATSMWTFLYLFRSNTQLLIDAIISELFRRYGMTWCNQRLYQARNKPLELLGHDHKVNYQKLFTYIHVILTSNLGSTIIRQGLVRGGVNPHFKTFFMFFDRSIKGFFGGNRQFIGINDCFLKDLYKRVLLSTVSVDANYGIYSLAICGIEKKNTDLGCT